MAVLLPAPPLPLGDWLRHPIRCTTAAWTAMHDSREHEPGGRPDPWVAGGLVLAAVILWVNQFVFTTEAFSSHLPAFVPGRYRELWAQAAWALARCATYGLVPLAWVRMGGRSWRDLGLAAPQLATQLRAILPLALAITPAVLVASTSARFQDKYPLYHLAGRSGFDFAVWELAYASQFFGIELFYRGFLLELLRPSCGAYALFVSAIPYCMIHFAKPPAEALGAIFAGIILGTLAVRRRSIVGGLLLHLYVAVTMDVLALAGRH